MSKRPCGVKHSDAIKRGLAAKKIRTNGIKRLTKERDAAMAEVERLRAVEELAQDVIHKAAEYLSQWAGYMISLNTISNVRALSPDAQPRGEP